MKLKNFIAIALLATPTAALANPSASGAYPISTLTWILAYKNGNGAKADDLRNTFNYILSNKAQMIADDLGYVPLAGSVLNKSRIAVKRISQ